MAVIFYDKGDHDSGFIGFRAVRTVGDAKDYRQKYFGLSEYSFSRAKELAYKQDAEWAKEAEEVLKDARVNKVRGEGGEHIIANGLRASFRVERRVRGGELRTYISPLFMVKLPGYGRGDKAFSISRHGYRKAYFRAVSYYCNLHGYDQRIKQSLLDKIPQPDVYLGPLANNLRENGHEVDIYDLYDKLGVVFKDGVAVIPDDRNEPDGLSM